MKSAGKQQPAVSSDVPPPLPPRTSSVKSVSILCVSKPLPIRISDVFKAGLHMQFEF